MGNTNKLYPDFTLTRTNCHEEPVHRPVAIQGRGHMLVLDTSQPLTLHAVSANLAYLLQCDESSMWNRALQDWLPKPIWQASLKFVEAGAKQSVVYAEESVRWTSPSSEQYDLVIHSNAGFVTVEFEPLPCSQLSEGTLGRIARRMANTDTLEELYATTTQLVAEAFHFDRVMVYKFDEDKHGCVVGETKQPHLEAYLGLHYPETDIPKIARDLFLKTKSRFISDINPANTTLNFNPSLGKTPPHLDLTFSQLRATSPIHIEYLANMGVTATLSISIIINGELWGLIACHHNTPLTIAFDHRVLSETIGDLLAKRIFELEIQRKTIQESNWLLIETEFLENVRHSTNHRIEILENASLLMHMCQADGAALVTLDECTFSGGLTPDTETLLEIRQWLVNQGHTEVFSTSSAGTVLPMIKTSNNDIGGILAACVSIVSHSYIFWFRAQVTKTTNWAGDPENSYTVSTHQDSQEIKLSPRQSFEKWKVMVSDQSHHWEASTLEMARRLRTGIFRKELTYSAELTSRANNDFMQLTFAAAHDLQEPLRTQANYLELIEEILALDSEHEVNRYLAETIRAGARMKELITDLLNFASLNGTTKRQTFALREVLDELQIDLASVITASSAAITVDSLPSMHADRGRVKQLMQNLLTNAIKYVAPGTVPEVSVYMKQEGSYYLLCVKDNGIGIEAADHEIVFKIFQRLHRKTEYEGTGIGLANCKKVAESMDATIGIDINEDVGCTFWVKLHKSTIVA